MKADYGIIKSAVQFVDDDDADCSDEAMQDVCDMVHAAPDIREDRVAAAKAALAQGTLPLRGMELVDKVLRGIAQDARRA